MMIEERIQALIHKFDVVGTRWISYAALTLAVILLAVWYDTHCYSNFSAPEAMDAAQVGRNLAEGHGFSTDFIRPFSITLVQKYNRAANSGLPVGANTAINTVDFARVYSPHPDLANPPIYPAILAGLFKVTSPSWKLETRKPFWADSGHFSRYKPEFTIAILNQLLLLASVWLTFMVARKILDAPAAWLAAAFLLFSDTLWKFSVSGLPVLLLLVIFLGLAWCLASFEELGQAENQDSRRRFYLAAAAGLLVGVGMLTRYSFGWMIIPVVAYFAWFGGTRRIGLGVVTVLVFGLVATPWILRNLAVSGTFFGTAGYAIVQETFVQPGSHLMQSISPDLTTTRWIEPYFLKLITNVRGLFREDVPHLGGGWMGILFLAGLLLGLRNIVARRLRYFALMCLPVMLVVSALGRTHLSTLSPEFNTENQLVLLMPLAIIFGVAFFLTLLSQMDVPSPPIRYGVIALVLMLVRLQFIMTLLPPKTAPSAYPPYFPPDIQKICAWMQPDELLMSDVPWAVAWYGHHQCAWTTVNCGNQFNALHQNIKPVRGLYLTLVTLDGRLMTECLQGGVDNWSNFAYQSLAKETLPDKFPLTVFPQDSLGSGMFLTDRERWPK